jgi:hypothetical protein
LKSPTWSTFFTCKNLKVSPSYEVCIPFQFLFLLFLVYQCWLACSWFFTYCCILSREEPNLLQHSAAIVAIYFLVVPQNVIKNRSWKRGAVLPHYSHQTCHPGG